MATITATLENMEQEMQKKNTEVHQARDQIGALKREEEDLQSQQRKLTKEISDLQSEIQKLEEEVEIRERLTSTSRDARKMYGDMTPGDVTHQDVILQYTNYFKDAFRNMPKALQHEDKYKVWQKCADIVQKSFEQNREMVITTIVHCLHKALTDKTDYLTEETIDLHRAFKMLINDMKKEDWEVIKRQVTADHEVAVPDDVFDWIIDVIINIDPSDYIHFIKTGETLKKKVQLPKTEKKQMPAAESIKKYICPACKEKVKEKSKEEAPQYHLGEYWHRHHMYCAICGGVIQSLDQFRFCYDHTYCMNCVCKACGKPTENESNVVTTEIGKLHMSCFQCHKCHHYDKTLMIVNNKFLCQYCYKPY